MRYILFALIFASSSNTIAGQTPSISQSEVKAVFLFNFIDFVEWPSNAFADKSTPLIIGVLGENPFGTYLDETVQSETKEGRPLKVIYFTNANAEEIGTCHILFINKTSDQLHQVLLTLKGHQILTVGDTPDFIAEGGMIRFFVENNKVRFQINIAAVKQQELAVSSKLLMVADVVNR